MSKTVEEVGLIVGGLALGGVAGLAYFGFLPFGMAAGPAITLTSLGATSLLSGIGLALRSTPKSLGTSNSIGFQNGDAPRRVIYGQFQTAGVPTYASFPPSQNLVTTNQYLHLVYTLAGHEISSFDAVVINGTVYNFGASTSLGDVVWESASGVSLWHVDPQAERRSISTANTCSSSLILGGIVLASHFQASPGPIRPGRALVSSRDAPRSTSFCAMTLA